MNRVVDPVLTGGLDSLATDLRYPSQARRMNQHGLVFVHFVVGRTGAVECAGIVRGSWDLLNEEALRVVRRRRFVPGTLDGEPVQVSFTLPIRFELR